jgi:Tol biopolymer transport system component
MWRTRPRSGSAIALLAGLFVLIACASSGAVPARAGEDALRLPFGSKRWIAYQSIGNTGNDRVFLVHVDGTDDHPIAKNLPGRTAHPDFSRYGHRLAFDQLTSDAATDQIYVSKADGSHIRHIAPCEPPKCLSHWEPAWSPNGSKLAISTASGPLTDFGPARFGIAIVDVSEGHVHPIVDHPAGQGQDHFARWSPDGHRLVFWRERSAEDGSIQTAIFIVNRDGSHLHRLTPWNMLAGEPDWAPHKALIVFCTRPLLDFPAAAESELYTMRPNGSHVHGLTSFGPDGPRATQPRWTPNGKAILYTRLGQAELPRHIWALTADGDHDVPVLTSKPIYTHATLRPYR